MLAAVVLLTSSSPGLVLHAGLRAGSASVAVHMQEASDSAVQASDDTVLFTALTGGDPSQPLRPRMVAYFQDSPGMANLGCLSVFRPELLERFTRVVEPDEREQPFKEGFFGRGAAPLNSISEAQFRELMASAGACSIPSPTPLPPMLRPPVLVACILARAHSDKHGSASGAHIFDGLAVSVTGEEELSDEDVAEFMAEADSSGQLTFERWLKVMVASSARMANPSKAAAKQDGGGGFFGMFGK